MKHPIGAFIMSLALLGTVLPLGAFAAGSATLTLEPTQKTVTEGSLFHIDIRLTPNGEEIDTVRANLQFDPQVLEVDSFALSSAFPRSAPGNTTDNEAGTLSEGGFNLEAPVTASSLFGTVAFRALNAGTTSIQVLDTSRTISNGEEKINTSLLGSTTVVVTPGSTREGVGYVSVTSSSHPNQDAWYVGNDVALEWTASEGTSITQYEVALDQEPETNPTTSYGATTLTYTKEDLADGIWYFHVKGRQTDGQDTDPVHFTIQIDSTAPNIIQPVVDPEQLSTEQETQITFATTDDGSGIDHYEIAFNNGGYTVVTSPLILKDLEADTYLIEVKAVDKAGNATYGATKMRVYPPELLPGVDLEALESEERKRLLIISASAIVLVLAIISAVKKFIKKRP